MTGGELQTAVIELAGWSGWKVAHFRSVAVQTRGGVRHMTPVGADGTGFPDLVLVQPTKGELYFREIKGPTERMRPEQKLWGQWLLQAGADWAVWRPSQWDEIIVPLLTFRRGRT